MTEHGYPLLYALFLWWFSTGLILYLDGLPRHTYRWSLAGASVLLVFALWGLVWSADHPTVAGAYVAFTSALLVWGWHEISFLMGAVTGPVDYPCPPGARGWRRLAHATGAVLWHELAIAMTGVLVIICTWDGANHVGTWTFMIFWWMRLSAKVNVYLGVRNLTEEFLPPRLYYLSSYFRHRPMNLFWPVSVLVSTIAAVVLVQTALVPGAPAFQAAGFTFLGGLLSLAVLEHWLLILPLPAARLWDWGLRSHRRTAAAVPATPVPADGPPVTSDIHAGPDPHAGSDPHTGPDTAARNRAPLRLSGPRQPSAGRSAALRRIAGPSPTHPISGRRCPVGGLVRPVPAPTTQERQS